MVCQEWCDTLGTPPLNNALSCCTAPDVPCLHQTLDVLLYAACMPERAHDESQTGRVTDRLGHEQAESATLNAARAEDESQICYKKRRDIITKHQITLHDVQRMSPS